MAQELRALSTEGRIESIENEDVLAKLVKAEGWRTGTKAKKTEIAAFGDIELLINGRTFHMLQGTELETEDYVESVITVTPGVLFYMAFRF